MPAPDIVILTLTAAAVLLSWGYARRYRLSRPPIGVIDLGDIGFMLGGVILIPWLYLELPIWLVGSILALGFFSILYHVGEPVLGSGAARLLAFGLVGADVALALRAGTTSPAYWVVNDLVLVLAVVGVTNLWAQSGLRARDLAIFAMVLAGYDLVATGLLPVTTTMVERLAGLALTPVAAWPDGGGGWVGIGLGDLLLAAVGPLVMRRAFGRTAGVTAIVLGLGPLMLLLLLHQSRVLVAVFPTMVVLGPLLAGQVAYWTRRCGPERTTAVYLAAEPLPERHRAPTPRAAITTP